MKCLNQTFKNYVLSLPQQEKKRGRLMQFTNIFLIDFNCLVSQRPECLQVQT